MMFGLLQALKSARLLPKQYAFRHASNITSKTAQGSIGVAESVFVMGFLFVAVLGPAGWILSNSCDLHRKPQ
ncbi:cytochrome c oxidase subunit 8B, mitochondrial-like [Triplophysa rosa]|uniref:cytochrome c oxidase subunit 8B, mitochondrial-like n=1 Tax=Triplophysa rosa TaxID=992332 RepID=UPI0025460602|nr:cytochrome c oxidase subunit 8B, mitochondrial-like [Triplophysa rosa]